MVSSEYIVGNRNVRLSNYLRDNIRRIRFIILACAIVALIIIERRVVK